MLTGGSLLKLSGVQLTAVDSIKSLGVWLNSAISLDKQLFIVAQSTFFTCAKPTSWLFICPGQTLAH